MNKTSFNYWPGARLSPEWVHKTLVHGSWDQLSCISKDDVDIATGGADATERTAVIRAHVTFAIHKYNKRC